MEKSDYLFPDLGWVRSEPISERSWLWWKNYRGLFKIGAVFTDCQNLAHFSDFLLLIPSSLGVSALFVLGNRRNAWFFCVVGEKSAKMLLFVLRRLWMDCYTTDHNATLKTAVFSASHYVTKTSKTIFTLAWLSILKTSLKTAIFRRNCKWNPKTSLQTTIFRTKL